MRGLETAKAHLADKIQEKISCQKKEAVELVDLVMETLKDALAMVS